MILWVMCIFFMYFSLQSESYSVYNNGAFSIRFTDLQRFCTFLNCFFFLLVWFTNHMIHTPCLVLLQGFTMFLNLFSWVLIFLWIWYYWRGDVRDRGGDGESDGEERGESHYSGEKLKESQRDEGKNSKGESKSWDYCIGYWSQLICLHQEVLLWVLISWTPFKHPHVSWSSHIIHS